MKELLCHCEPRSIAGQDHYREGSESRDATRHAHVQNVVKRQKNKEWTATGVEKEAGS